MAVKKNYRANNTYLIEGGAGDNPKLMAQVLNDGRESLYLEYYLGYSVVESKGGNTYKKVNRKTERLGLYLWQAPRTPIERKQNKETLKLAKKIRFERGQEMLKSTWGYRLRKDRQINFLDYFKAYVDNYTKKDVRVVEQAYREFVKFLNETPNFEKYAKNLKPEYLSKDMMLSFTEYLNGKNEDGIERHKGIGALSVYKRFKTFINYAIEHDVIIENPCKGVVIKIDDNILRKDVLSLDEIEILINTHYVGENINIRKAFILSLYCGLRFCDVKDLTFANVDYSNKLLKFEQNKTKGHSNNSGVVIPLNDDLLSLIGEPTEDIKRTDLIFSLPSHTMCLKALRRWVKTAGIDKHITWHCARHSFAVNILNNGANIKTVASLLGHSGLSQTEKYTRAIDSLKQDAINSLPKLKL